MIDRGSGKAHTAVRATAILGALLALLLAARPIFTDAQGDPTPATPPASPTTTDEITSGGGPTGSGDDEAGSPGRAEPTDPTSQPPLEDRGPSLVYVDGSLEVAPDGAFGTVIEVVDAPAGSDLAVQIYDRITTVDQLEASATDLPANLLATFDTIPLAADDPPATQLSSFIISLYSAGQPRPPEAGAWAYRLDEPGVYPVRVRLRGPDGDQLDSFVTYLARTPELPSDPGSDAEGATPDAEATPATAVALLARIHEDPPIGDSETTAAVDRAIDDDRLLAIERFASALTEEGQLPVTFSITPDTARRLHQNGSSLPTSQRLRAALVDDDRALLSAPYVDVDIPSLLAADLGDELDFQIMLGFQYLQVALDQTGTDTWLIERPIDEATVDALTARSVTGAVLGPDVLVDEHHSPVLVEGSDSTLAGLPLFDTGLGEARTSSAGDPNDLLAAHHAVGRLAALRGIEGRGAVVAVALDPDLAPGRLASFLDLLGTAPDHVQLSTADRLLDDVEVTEPSALVAPSTDGDGEPIDQLRSTRLQVESYRSMLAADSPDLNEFDLPMAISVHSGRPEEARRADLDRISSTIDDRFGSITAPERDRVTLGTRDATFPLPISTDSTEPLRVRIDIQASDRVELPRSSFETTLTGERTVVQIPVRTRASGDTTLLISVSTPDGAVVLTESRYTIRSTAVSGVGVLLTIGAGGFLAIWWGRHWYRTRRGPATPARHARNDPDPDPGL